MQQFFQLVKFVPAFLEPVVESPFLLSIGQNENVNRLCLAGQ